MKRFEGACETCGTHFTGRIASGATRRFCSNDCRLAWFSTEFRGTHSPQWKGGSLSRYGAHWKATRLAVYERDGNRCRACGAERAVDRRLIAAHLQDRRWFVERGVPVDLADHPANLVALCNPCHISFDRAEGTRWDSEKCDRGFWPEWAEQRVTEACDWAEEILRRYRPHLLRSPLTSPSLVAGAMPRAGTR